MIGIAGSPGKAMSWILRRKRDHRLTDPPGVAGYARAHHVARDPRPPEALRRDHRARRARARRAGAARLRLPRLERRRQDDDDAHRARRPARRRWFDLVAWPRPPRA